MSGSDTAHLLRVRDNQRRSRARRKEYLQEVEGRLRDCEQNGIELSAELQAAARKVAEENKRLRLLLIRRGISSEELAMALGDAGVTVQENESWEIDQLRSDAAEILDGLLRLGENGRRLCGKNGECSPTDGRQLFGSPTTTQPTQQSGMWGPQTSHTPDKNTGSKLQSSDPTSSAAAQLDLQPSDKVHYEPRAQIHQFNALVMPSPGHIVLQQHAQTLASMSGQHIQAEYQAQPEPHRQAALEFHQPMQQRLEPFVLQQPAFQSNDSAALPNQSHLYGQGIGTNSCVYATDMITSMATNAHPVDVRTDLGCPPHCITDCEVDNRTVFAVMDRYSAIVNM